MEIEKEKIEPTRPIRKINEHIQDALFHLYQADLPPYVKAEIDGLLVAANDVLIKAVRS